MKSHVPTPGLSRIFDEKEDKQKPLMGTCTSNPILPNLCRERERARSTDSNSSSQSACLYGRSGRRPSLSGMISGSEANRNSERDSEMRDRFTNMGLQNKKKKGIVHLVREIDGVLVDEESVDG